MAASLIRSRAMVTHAIDRHRWSEIEDGAVLQEDGIIVEIGTYQELSRQHPNLPAVGSGKRNVNLYLDTLYSAFEMIASGVTTVQHLHGRLPGNLDQVDRGCDEVIRAYRDVGMRVAR
jgi:5-methylthioadenosine/S-adenosylhomocysteine deaminase